MTELTKKSQELRSNLPPERSWSPPEMKGQLLGTLSHKEGAVRIVWDEYEGHPYLSIRLWTADNSGQLWPSKTGFTVKLRDLPTLGEAIGKALDLALKETGGGRSEREREDRYARSREGVGAPF